MPAEAVIITRRRQKQIIVVISGILITPFLKTGAYWKRCFQPMKT
jgi:hypothetical protein